MGGDGQVLELVLQGCNGDVVKAIEHFLAAAEARRGPPLVADPRAAADDKSAFSPPAPPPQPQVPSQPHPIAWPL